MLFTKYENSVDKKKKLFKMSKLGWSIKERCISQTCRDVPIFIKPQSALNDISYPVPTGSFYTNPEGSQPKEGGEFKATD